MLLRIIKLLLPFLSLLFRGVDAYLTSNSNAVSFRQKISTRRKKMEKNVPLKERISYLNMGGYYVEPSNDGSNGSDRKLEYDHMIFGLPCKERQINLPVSGTPKKEKQLSFLTLDPVMEHSPDSPQHGEDDSKTRRLADYLITRREELVSNKRVLILGASSWIGLLLTRLGASMVMVWDCKENEINLRLLEHTDQFINQRQKDNCVLQPFTSGKDLLQREEKDTSDNEYLAIDLIIVVNNSSTTVYDTYLQDFLHQTDATLVEF